MTLDTVVRGVALGLALDAAWHITARLIHHWKETHAQTH